MPPLALVIDQWLAINFYWELQRVRGLSFAAQLIMVIFYG